MNAPTRTEEPAMQAEITEFTALLHQQGVHAALGYLNRRTPHRYTGMWRFDGDMLRSEVLFDRKMADVRQGADAPMAATYCSLVGRYEAPVQILDATVDPQALGIETPVISYCGALIRDGQGQAFGTLCHYDLQRCQERTSDQPLLMAAAQLLYERLHPTTAG
ncbi:hypothetical protein [Hymenobacter rubripertinctus]|uniref:GAF domain-containing protein n=1 Tax=Hymenobacter rubripertinctus TaxID=2029981 RepID=A0A418R4M0_9BACT|nr:hypothetical protein [Hymenobacter rubripertinctus]RIY12387.1 hypothetical protein D0T11_05085 [Hymenobacter rubripertinctus]